MAWQDRADAFRHDVIAPDLQYGPSADRLLTVTLPVLKKFRAPAGSYLTKRYGKPGARQERISLSGD